MTTFAVTAAMAARRVQEACLYARDGDVVAFGAGTYTMLPWLFNALLYCPRACVLDFSAGAVTLQAAAGATTFLPAPEYAIGKYAAFQGLFDAQLRYSPGSEPTLGSYNESSSVLITIDSVGATDTFKLSIDGGAPTATLVAITGDWQDTGYQGIQVKFGATTGHTLNDVIYAYPATTPLHGIMFGNGLQTVFIDGARVKGQQNLSIDLQFATVNPRTHNSQAETSGAVTLNGRTRNGRLSGYKAVNMDRPAYIRPVHTGYVGVPASYYRSLNYGGRLQGQSMDCEFAVIDGVTDLDIVRAKGFILTGHPSMRGKSTAVSVLQSDISGYEPNFRQSLCELMRSWSRHPSQLDGWRGPKQQHIEGNVSLVTQSAPDPYDPHTPNGWPELGISYRRANSVDTGATPAPSEWVDTFPTGWTLQKRLVWDLGRRAAGFVYLPIYDAGVMAAINSICGAGGPNLRASSDAAGAAPVPLHRIVDDSGVLVGLGVGVTLTGGPVVLHFWSKAGEVAPPRADARHGEWRAMWPGTVACITGDASFVSRQTAQTVAAGRLTATGAKLGQAITFNGSQSIMLDSLLDDDTRQMSGVYFGAWVTPAAGGRLLQFGSGALRVDSTSYRACLSTAVVSGALSGTSHIAYVLEPTALKIYVNGELSGSALLAGRSSRLASFVNGSNPGGAVIRIGGGLMTNSWIGTAGQIQLVRRALSGAQIAAYVAACNEQGSMSLSPA